MRLLVNAGEDPQTICNLDAEVWTPDGKRWSATIFTVDEVHRLLTRWRDTGEYSSDLYWYCPNGLIVREPGIDCVVAAVTDLVREGLLSEVLQLVGSWANGKAVDDDDL